MDAIRWDGVRLFLLDQRRLPHEEVWLTIETADGVVDAIRGMAVRGAPAIAIAAGYGLAMAVAAGEDRAAASGRLLGARPTAVNLRWALDRLEALPDTEVAEGARGIHAEDVRINRALSAHGSALLEGGVLTICNTGALATGGHGTALGMIRTAHAAGRQIRAYMLETRPYLQGARLTAFECWKDQIPSTLVTDSMAGALMASGRVKVVVVGCDRVALNGDTANKIGTLQLAVLAAHYGLPFYVAMPTSTLDRCCPGGQAIPIEERGPAEVTHIAGHRIAPEDVHVWNPAFDVTPASLITAWVTEHGIWTVPFPSSASVSTSQNRDNEIG